MPVPAGNFFEDEVSESQPNPTEPTADLDPKFQVPTFDPDDPSWPKSSDDLERERMEAEADEEAEERQASEEPEPEPDREPEPEPQRESQELNQLKEEIDSLKRQLSQADDRQTQQNLGAEIAKAMEYRERLKEWREQQKVEQEPPDVDVNRMLESEEYAQKALTEFGEYGYRKALKAMQPYLQESAQAAHVLQNSYPMLAQMSEDMAYEKSKAAGVVEDREDFDGMLERALGIMNEYSEGSVHMVRLNPDIVHQAVTIAKTQSGGKPIKTEPKKPQSLGKGDVQSKPSSPASYNNSTLSKIEKAFKVRIPKDKKKEFAEKHSRRRA